jgi:hypothetical protein
MKLPRWDGTRPSTYLFSLVCFIVGYGVITVLSLGQIKYDDGEGPGWNPVTKLPDGKVGLSEFAIETIGCLVLCLCLALITMSGVSFRNPPTQVPFGEYTIKSRSDHLQIRP